MGLKKSLSLLDLGYAIILGTMVGLGFQYYCFLLYNRLSDLNIVLSLVIAVSNGGLSIYENTKFKEKEVKHGRGKRKEKS